MRPKWEDRGELRLSSVSPFALQIARDAGEENVATPLCPPYTMLVVAAAHGRRIAASGSTNARDLEPAREALECVTHLPPGMQSAQLFSLAVGPLLKQLCMTQVEGDVDERPMEPARALPSFSDVMYGIAAAKSVERLLLVFQGLNNRYAHGCSPSHTAELVCQSVPKRQG